MLDQVANCSPHEPDLLEGEERHWGDAGQAFFHARQGVYRGELSETDPTAGFDRSDGQLRCDAELGRRESAEHEFLCRPKRILLAHLVAGRA